MKIEKSVLWGFVLLVVVASLYRIMPNRPMNFAPQIAMALFAGSIIKNKKWAFLLPLASMLFSDCLYELLYRNGVGNMQGFYEGQVTNYILFCLMTVVGFFVNSKKPLSIAAGALIAPSIFFVLSNFFVWFAGAGYARPKTFDGLMLCYADAVPFFKWSVIACLVFSTVLFGAYYLLAKSKPSASHQAQVA